MIVWIPALPYVVIHLLHCFSSRQQLPAAAQVLSGPAVLLPRHQRRHPRRVPEGRQIPLLPLDR